MKRYPPSFVIREFQIQTTIRYHDTPARMAKIWITDNHKCWEGCGTRRTLIHCCGNAKWHMHFGRLSVSHQTKHIIPHGTAAMLPGTDPKELNTYVHTETHAWMFTAAPFIISQT